MSVTAPLRWTTRVASVFAAGLVAMACGRTDPSDLGDVAPRDPRDSGLGDGSTSAAFGSFGDAASSEASIAWCDAGPPDPFTLAGVTCGLFLAIPCGLPLGVVPEPSGLLAPDVCAMLCPKDQSWESCSVYGGDGSTGPSVVVVCVPDCT